METLLQSLPTDFSTVYLIPWAIRLASALAIFVIGRWLAKWLVNTFNKLMKRGGMDSMLAQFITNILYTALLVVVVIAALDRVGVQTTSLLAIVGAAGLAIGLALKDSLANFSSGVMLIIFRPFKVGDFIEAAGTSGVVIAVNIFSTLLRTGDNRDIIVPNSQIYSGIIINVTAQDKRRIDMVFGIGYDDDIRTAKRLITEVMQQDARILTEPAPAISVAELADSSVNLNVRPWTKTTDYWAVRSDLLENIKASFDANGISIPYPQRDVHLHQVGDAA
ncbi:MAG: mechanosensitive ion channel [Gammaproteobacteria bacterium]|nr:mechanosensitive ion channel [Gammaproteobacteria bacterium]MBU2479398.1 mechanosensitive ion channel [Gammaproteobacteria bacterium]